MKLRKHSTVCLESLKAIADFTRVAIIASMAYSFIVMVSIAPLTAGPIESEQSKLQSPEPIYRDILKIDTDDSSQPGIEHLQRAVDRYREAKFDDALAAFRDARQVDGKLPLAELMLARLFLADGHIPVGRRALEQAAVAAPDDPDVYLVFGYLALHEGRLTDAELHFTHTVSLLADADRTRMTQVLDGLAAVAEFRGLWPAAEEELHAWLKLDNDDVTAWRRLGRVRFEQEHYKEAADAFAKAETYDPEGEPAAIVMGRLYHHAGNRDKADEWMTYAVKKSPKNPRVHAAVALWRLEVDQPDEAQKHLDETDKLDPAFPELKRLQGLAARYRRDWLVAAKVFESLLAENPADFAASNQLALVLIEQDELKRRRAVQLAEINARQYPQNAEALATLGWIYHRAGQLDEAERVLRTAISSGTANSETAYYLAQVLITRKNYEEARPLLTAAVAATGPFMFRTQAQAWLDQHGDPKEKTN